MFTRLKTNKSGSTSVHVISKRPYYHVVKSFGTSRDPHKIEQMRLLAEDFISGKNLRLPINPQISLVEFMQQHLRADSITQIGPELIFGTIFDQIGFNALDDDIFRLLVIARIVHPFSKVATVRYLSDYLQEDIDINRIYRFLDRLEDKNRNFVSKVAYNYTRETLGEIHFVFYDITTLYYESSREDEFRIPGYSKDGKFHKPQILLGFLLAQDGYPISYEVFEGNTFEGHTLIPSIKALCAKFSIKDPIIIADSGMLSSSNLKALRNAKLRYIVGARIKNINKDDQDKVLSAIPQKDSSSEIELDELHRLIITHSTKREEKDKYNRERGIRKLKKKMKSGKLTKSNINNRGYNKYLKLEGHTKISFDNELVETDANWDGLKGYITNVDKNCLDKDQIVKNYTNLWLIERAFKISKTDLKIRPIYHRVLRRIRAHIAISFAAYTIIIEVERRLRAKNSSIGIQRTIEVSKLIRRTNFSLRENPSVRFSKVFGINQEVERLFHALSIRVPH